ncbi:MAG: hypothetical protein Mars2KO_44460 [Maribacter sp.]
MCQNKTIKNVTIGKGNVILNFIDGSVDTKSLESILQSLPNSNNKNIKELEDRNRDLENQLKEATKLSKRLLDLFSKGENKIKKLKVEIKTRKIKLRKLREESYKSKNSLVSFFSQFEGIDLSISSSSFQKAILLFTKGKLDDALLILNDKDLEAEERVLADKRFLASDLLLLKGDVESAEKNLRRGLEIHPSIINKFKLGHFLYHQNRIDDALVFFDELVNNNFIVEHSEEFRKMYGHDSAFYMSSLQARIYHYCSLVILDFNYEIQISLLEQSIKVNTNTFGKIKNSYNQHIDMLCDLIDFYSKTQNLSKIKELLRNGEKIISKVDNKESKVNFIHTKAISARYFKNKIDSNKLYCKALKILETMDGEYSPATVLHRKASIYLGLSYHSEFEKSVEYANNGAKIFKDLSELNSEKYFLKYLKAMGRKALLFFDNLYYKNCLQEIDKITDSTPSDFHLRTTELQYDRILGERYDFLGDMYFLKVKCLQKLEKPKEIESDMTRVLNYYSASIENGQPKNYANKICKALIHRVTLILNNYIKADGNLIVKSLYEGLWYIRYNNPDSEMSINQEKKIFELLRTCRLSEKEIKDFNQTVDDKVAHEKSIQAVTT